LYSKISFNKLENINGSSIPMYERSEVEIINFIENNSSSTKKNRHSTPSNETSVLKTCRLLFNSLANSKNKSIHTLAKEQKKRVRTKVIVDETKYIRGEYSKA
jgi:hypothetical protein